MNLPSRIALKHIAAAKIGPVTEYEDWKENSPAFSKMQTIAPALMRKMVLGLRLQSMPASMRFFQIVDQVFHMSMGAPVEDLSQEFRAAARYLSQAVSKALKDEKGASLANAITDCAVDNAPLLRRIGAGAKGLVFTDFGLSVAGVVETIAKAAGISAGSAIKTVEGTRWPTIRVLSKEEGDLKSLQENNPKLYSELIGNVEEAAKFHAKIEKAVTENGLVPTTVAYEGVPLPASEDYTTKEKTVYLQDGRVLPLKEFRREMAKQKKKEAYLTSQFSPMYVFNSEGKPEVVRRPEQLKLEGLIKVSDADLANPEIIPLNPDGTEQKVEFRAMTDDKATAMNRGTRIYPTRRDINGQAVIVDGRFKGFYLDDMVNQRGRLVEGTAYDMNEDGIPVAFDTEEADGSLRLSAVNKEPYVTLNSEGKFLIKIPFIGGGRGTKDPFTRARTAMKDRASIPDKVEWVKDPATGKREKKVTKGRTRSSIYEVPRIGDEASGTLFTFEVQDFSTVRTAVGGMCMSAEAAKKLREYYNQQARIEESTRLENTKSYSLDRIGGFKTKTVIDKDTGESTEVSLNDLMSKQKEALSWIEAKGYKGLAALDTGVGKTLLTIATMQKMVRDGAAGEGSRFLYVCPDALKGNFPMELQTFMTEEAARGLQSRVDRMSYEEFTFKVMGGKRPVKQKVPGTEKQEKVIDPATGKPMRGPDGKLMYRAIPGTEKEVTVKDPVTGKRMSETVVPDPDLAKKYAAVFFDEAHVLVKDENNRMSVAAQKFDHPRKVLLTASPMEEDPDELYIGVAITNNVKLSRKAMDLPRGSRSGLSQAQKDLMAFRRRFCERVGGRTVGLKDDPKNDPTGRQDFNAWVKNGMYFADKRTIGAPGTSEDEQKKKKLPDLLKQQATTLTMEPEVEIEYRKAAKGMSKVLKAMVRVFRDRAKDKELSKAEKDLISRFETEFRKYRKYLDALANYPDEVVDPATGEKKFPNAVSPKIAKATSLVNDKIEGGKRTVLFTDDDKFAMKTVETLSRNTPDMGIAVALKGRITVYRNGSVYTKEGEKQVFVPKEYTGAGGKIVPKAEWASHVLRNIIGADPSVKALILTKPYALGQNLQMFSTVVHLDRDTFSNEMMKQRTARVWRTGQKEPVEEYTMDTVYDEPDQKDDPTLDEVRKYVQELQEDVFNEIVHKSQETVLGEEWKSMTETQASLVQVNRKMFEQSIAPYIGGLAEYLYNQAAAKA